MFELFHNVTFDWIGKRKIFIGVSILIMLAGLASAIGRQLVPGGTDAFNLNTDNTPTGQGNNATVYAYGVNGGKDTFTDYAMTTYINGSGVIVQAAGTGTAYIYDDKHDFVIYAAV